MKYTVRALLAIGLLLGFYVVAIGVVVGLGFLVVEAAIHGLGGVVLGKFGLVFVLVALAIGRGLFTRRKHKVEPGGFLVSPSEQPDLWAEVRELAAVVGTRVPEEIRLVAEVNAAVSEDARFLGLVPGTRRLYVGVPLLVGLNRSQLRSVLAHELGHYSGRHTALGPITYRGKEAIGRVLGELGPDSLIGRLLGLYGRLYYAVSHGVSRRQELEADQFSLTVAGRSSAVSALRELAPLDSAWRHFVDDFVGLGNTAGLRPDTIFDGFAQMLNAPETVEILGRIRAESPEPEPSVYDTHPPTSQRIAAIEATVAPDVPVDERPGTSLIANSAQTWSRFEAQLFDGSGLTPSAWDDVVAAEGERQTADAARYLATADAFAGIPRSADGLLGRLATPGATGFFDGEEPERERAFVARLVGDVVAGELIRRGDASFGVSWGSTTQLRAADGTPLDPWAPARVAAESGDGTPLREFAARHGVDLTSESAPPTESVEKVVTEDEDAIVGVVAPVKFHWGRALVVTHRGLHFARVSWGQMFAFGLRVQAGGGGGKLAAKQAERSLSEIRDDRRTISFTWDQIARFTVTPRSLRASRIDIELVGADAVVVKFGDQTGLSGEPWQAAMHYLGDRYVYAGT